LLFKIKNELTYARARARNEVIIRIRFSRFTNENIISNKVPAFMAIKRLNGISFMSYGFRLILINIIVITNINNPAIPSKPGAETETGLRSDKVRLRFVFPETVTVSVSFRYPIALPKIFLSPVGTTML
jgi:hypothetical protein